jgi:transcriptional regulator with PAS, ATPase and Fis domain
LLRVLQDGEIRPIGAKNPIHTDVRIIAATNADLKKLVQEGKFRQDLFYRLNVITVQVPALRERPEDIPLLVEYFGMKISEELGRTYKKLPESAMQKFLEHDWPGNIRELENEVRKMIILESDYRLDRNVVLAAEEDLSLDAAEKQAILKALDASHGNKRKAAEMLGMPRSSFYVKLTKYKIF